MEAISQDQPVEDVRAYLRQRIAERAGETAEAAQARRKGIWEHALVLLDSTLARDVESGEYAGRRMHHEGLFGLWSGFRTFSGTTTFVIRVCCGHVEVFREEGFQVTVYQCPNQWESTFEAYAEVTRRHSQPIPYDRARLMADAVAAARIKWGIT